MKKKIEWMKRTQLICNKERNKLGKMNLWREREKTDRWQEWASHQPPCHRRYSFDRHRLRTNYRNDSLPLAVAWWIRLLLHHDHCLPNRERRQPKYTKWTRMEQCNEALAKVIKPPLSTSSETCGTYHVLHCSRAGHLPIFSYMSYHYNGKT